MLPLSLHKEKNHFLTNIMIQVPLKQDQVEVSATDFIPDYTDCVLIHRGVVEDLNKTVRVSLNRHSHKQPHRVLIDV